MAGKADILAGRAAVELLLKDNQFSKGITAAGQRLKSFGRGVSIFGAAIAGAGASITAPILAAVHSVVEYGSELKVLSERTGLTVESMAELRYAAEQTGGSLEAVEKALLFAGKKGFDPRKFDEIAAKLSAIDDPAKRLKETFKIFGRGAGPIIPMLEKLPELRKEARDLGLVMDAKTATAAHKLHNAFNTLGRVVGGTKNAIGAALIPTVQSAVEWLQRIAISVREWVRANKELFVTAFKIGVVLTVVGTAIATLGGVIAASGFALIGINGVLGLMAGLFTALISPIGLAVAAVAGLATWFATSTTWGQQMVQSLAGWFGQLKDIAVEAFGGIADALSGGNLALAAEIAWQGLLTAFLKATEGIRVAWAGVGNGIVNVMKTVAVAVEGAWSGIAYSMKAVWASLVAESKTIGEQIGHNISRDQGESVESLDRKIAAVKEGLKTADATIGAAGAKTLEDLEQRRKSAKILGEKGQRELQEDQDREHNKALGRIKKEHDARQDSIAAELQAKLDALKNVDLTGGSSAADIAKAKSAAAEAQTKLDALRKQAAGEAKNAKLGAADPFKVAQVPSAQALKQKVFGTFSAAAFAAGGGSGGVDQQTLEQTKLANRNWQQHLKTQDQIRIALVKKNADRLRQ